MVSAIKHLDIVRQTLKSHEDVFKFLKKNSVKVLDVECGSGRIFFEELLPILPKNFSELIGVDKHQSMTEHCRSLNADPRISFQQLDITTKDLPKNFLGRFDFITSFFCLHYAREYTQMLQNMHDMLKQNGELLFIQAYRMNPVYHTYKELSRMDTWKPYFEDFADYTCPYEGNDPESKLKELLHKNNLNLLRYKFEPISMECISKNFIETLKSFDTRKYSIPPDKREEYNRDFHKCFSKILNVDFVTESGLNKKVNLKYHQLTVYADKI